MYLEDLCFDAQQAAEKAFKALLLHRKVDFPRIHDLAELINLLASCGEEVPEQVREAGRCSASCCTTHAPPA